jgi:hypothetical protein
MEKRRSLPRSEAPGSASARGDGSDRTCPLVRAFTGGAQVRAVGGGPGADSGPASAEAEERPPGCSTPVSCWWKIACASPKPDQAETIYFSGVDPHALEAMLPLLGSLLRLLVSPANVRDIALENLALRQQLALFTRKCPRPRLRGGDRYLLGVVVQELEGLAPGAGHRETGDGCGLTSPGPSPALDLDFQADASSGKPPRTPFRDCVCKTILKCLSVLGNVTWTQSR